MEKQKKGWTCELKETSRGGCTNWGGVGAGALDATN